MGDWSRLCDVGNVLCEGELLGAHQLLAVLASGLCTLCWWAAGVLASAQAGAVGDTALRSCGGITTAAHAGAWNWLGSWCLPR